MASERVTEWRERGPEDGSRRYVPHHFSFDTRAHLLSTPIESDWEEGVRAQWEANRRAVCEGVMYSFGVENYEQKIENFADLDVGPWSVVALHNTYLSECRSAFAAGFYYPALLGACGLGERVLNQLVLRLRDDYAERPSSRPILKKASIDKWDKAISALADWGVFSPEVTSEYRKLLSRRNAAVHYRTALDSGDARDSALVALRAISRIIQGVFAPIGEASCFFQGPLGRSYVKREAEGWPFVREFILPACVLVSPRYRFVPAAGVVGGLDIYDDPDFGVGARDLTDDEFADCRVAQVEYPF